MSLRRSMILLFASVVLTGTVAYANTAPAANREEVRKKLEAFFAHIDDKSPDALKNISKSPETLQAIDKRIAGMSDAEVDEFQKMMREVPDWQKAPQAIATMLPPDAMKTIQKASADFTKRAPQAEKMRSDISTLATVLKMLPDAKLQELGLTREQLASLDGALTQISPLQAGIFEQQLSKDAGWQAKSDAAMSALPPALQKGAEALAKHGPLTALDKVELEKFRSSMQDLLARVNALPEDTKKQLKLAELGPHIAAFRTATPEVLFMIREQTTPEALQQLSDSVALMERVSKLTDDEKKSLESFRGDLASLSKSDSSGNLAKKVDSLSEADLLMARDKITDFDTWKERSAAYMATINDPAFAQRMQAAQKPSPDPAVVASLEQFRAQELQAIAQMAPSNPQAAEMAAKNVTSAPLAKLEFLRSITANPISAQAHLHIAANFQASDCDFTILDFSSICQAIIDTINAISSGAANAVKTAMTAITDALQAGLNAVTNTVNSIVDGLVSTVNGIVSTANSIWNFVQTIPSLAWNAIKTAFQAILNTPLPGTNGLTLNALISGHLDQVVPALQSALNLGSDFWNSLNGTLPQIPCPPAGFSTPFGSVGSDDAAAKYNHYAFFLDKIFGLIPSDVFSLEVKVPAQVLYAAWQYLGVCLNEAAQTADAAAAAQLNTDRYNNLILAGGNNTSAMINAINGNFSSLSMTLNNDFSSLSNLTSTDDANLTTLINNKFNDMTNLLKQRTDDAKALALRLAIEQDLQTDPPQGLLMFQVPQANGGYLELVRDTVNSDITNFLATGQSAGHAQQFFSDGLSQMSNGKFKDAYKSFQKAYQELIR